MCLIRNHAEAVLAKRENSDLTNMLGYNFRLGEIEAAISIVQLNKLEAIVAQRISAANYIKQELKNLPGLLFPEEINDVKHVYYVLGMLLDPNIKFKREEIIAELNKRGIFGMMNGYANIHILPIFQTNCLWW